MYCISINYTFHTVHCIKMIYSTLPTHLCQRSSYPGPPPIISSFSGPLYADFSGPDKALIDNGRGWWEFFKVDFRHLQNTWTLILREERKYDLRISGSATPAPWATAWPWIAAAPSSPSGRSSSGTPTKTGEDGEGNPKENNQISLFEPPDQTYVWINWVHLRFRIQKIS